MNDYEVYDNSKARIKAASEPDMIQISPTRWVPSARMGGKVPKYSLCKWMPEADGYSPAIRACNLQRITKDLLKALGFTPERESSRYETLFRLYNAGYISMVKISPRCWMLDIDSWYRHVERCIENPDMWEVGSKDYQKYCHDNDLLGI